MWRLFAAVAITCIALLLWPDALIALRWQRGAIGDGQGWRMLSAHFAHLGVLHAFANLAGMALVIGLLGTAMRAADAVWVMLVSALTIIAGLSVFNPALGWYAGLSGVVHGLWAGCAVLGCCRPGPPCSDSARQYVRAPHLSVHAAALGVLLLKLMLPSLPWQALTSGLPVVLQSHLYGALGGTVAALALLAAASSRGRRRQCE